MKLVIFTICQNEAESIGKVLDRIPKKIPGIDKIETLVVSDGSTDNTVKIAQKHGATQVVDGLGKKRLAYRFEQALEAVLEMNPDIACNIDGDLQFDPHDIPKMIKPIIEDGYDFVAADRFTDPKTGLRRKPVGMPGGKYWGNVLGAWTISQLTGQKFMDVTCGFRAYNRKALLAININGGYTYTQESFQVLAVKKMNITSVPVPVTYYQGRQSRVVRKFWQFIFGSALNIIRAFRDYAPLKFFGLAGLPFFIVGSCLSIFVAWHWISAGLLTPYKAVGFIGVYAISIAVILWALGLVADMFDRILRTQEKILTETKKARLEQRSVR